VTYTVRASWSVYPGERRELRCYQDGSYDVWETDRRGVSHRLNSDFVRPDDLAAILGLPVLGPRSAAERRSQDAQIAGGALEGTALPAVLDDPDGRFREALADWCRSRSERGKRVTATVARKTLAELAKWTRGEAIEALEASAKNGWTGVFRPKATIGQKPVATEHRAHAIARFGRRDGRP
jgi:hypothetical protein